MKDFEFYKNLIELKEQCTTLSNERLTLAEPLLDKLPYKKAKLNTAHRVLLNSLASQNECTVASIAAAIFFKPQYTSKLVNTLCEKGYVEKSKSQRNKSAVSLRLTEKGRNLVAKATKAQYAYIKSKVEPLDKEVQARFLECSEYIYSILLKIIPNKIKLYDSKNYFDRLYHALIDASPLFNALSYDVQSNRISKSSTFSEHLCTSLIMNHSPISLTELAQKVSMPVKNVSKFIAKYLKLGYIERVQRKDDRRIFDIRMTEKGHKEYMETSNQTVYYFQQVFSTLTDSECERFADSFTYWNNLVSSF